MDSYVTLEPGETVIIKLRASADTTVGERARLAARVLYSEYTVEDSRYMVNAESYEIVSPEVIVSQTPPN